MLGCLCPLSAQQDQGTAGDEDGQMYNDPKIRDRTAINRAVNGWWAQSMETRNDRIKWWREARFGMFIHWGVYSLPGGEWKGKKVGGYAEHLMRKEKISRAEYQELAGRFNPVAFDAETWIKTAKRAGMKYFVITAKHHDGFAMYSSEVSDFNITDRTPFKRDPLAELAAACKKNGIKFGFYYSHAFDWEHPDAPGNDWEYQNPGGDKNLYGGRYWYDEHPELVPKAVKYVNEKAIPQIKELIKKYHPDILWFDTPHKLPLSENIRILRAIRETDPDVVVNGRLVRSAQTNFGDYKNTADRPAEFFPVEGDWEAIPTTNESYGYSKYDTSHKPAGFFIRLLAKAVSEGGNLLMNIGPMGNGAFDPRDKVILDSIGKWMHKNGESIYGAAPSGLPLQNWGVTTQKGDKIYLHVFRWPRDGKLVVGGLGGKIRKARLLASPSKKLTTETSGATDMIVKTPAAMPDKVNTVIVLETGENTTIKKVPRLLSAAAPNRLLAFDAGLHGDGFKFGDGKPHRYYVYGWQDKNQSLSWDFRLHQAAEYRIEVKYTTDGGGRYSLTLGDTRIEKEVDPSDGEIITKEIGTVSIPEGEHKLTLKPLKIEGEELMKLFEIQFIPVKK
ncbi:alpha-L-fucosidase [Sinomicrobium sp. FJxs]|uniref:alpha-L-fucosidase n=2 Tax=Sinomicrobium weinanense TaxID=2842200 RepID=A0A926Q434_9FLAO|nr:alpha-L-fucosidase [Sinomicrobium weinanense]